MTCFTPLTAYRNPISKGYISGKGKPFVVSKKRLHLMGPSSHPHLEWLQLPCGQCSGCRFRRSASWAARCMHEALLYRNNCFVTLTYNSDHVPLDGSLRKSDAQKFLKRLRKKYIPKCPFPKDDFHKIRRAEWHQANQIRYYYCGEYGDKFGRPHYHFILFNHDFSDKKFWKKSKSGFPCFRSPSLEELWPFGNSEIGNVTFESCAYVARYVMKKINGELADTHYLRHDPDGRVYKILPEFTNMSLKPGIGAQWFEQYSKDVYPHDYVVLSGGRKMQPPKYYDGLYELTHDAEGVLYNWPRMEAIKRTRQSKALLRASDNTPERLDIKREILEARSGKYKRNL